MYRLPPFARVCLLIGLLVAIFGGAQLALVYLDQRWATNTSRDAMTMWFEGPDKYIADPPQPPAAPVSPVNDDGSPKDVMLYRRDLFPLTATVPATPNRDRAFKAIVLIASGLAVATASLVLPARASRS